MAFDPHKYLADLEKMKGEAQALVTDMLSREYSADHWRGLIAVPEGSMLESVLKSFYCETDIPLELPFFVLLHFISGYLLSKGVKIKSSGGECYPEIWTIVLAESGSGKTLAHDTIAAEAPVKSTFPEPASDVAFIESMVEHNYGLWFQDEIAEFMKKIESRGSMHKIKQHLLNTFSNTKISRARRVDPILIEEPCLGILGLNTPKSFFNAIKPGSLLDGFAQRFGYVVAQPDPDRNVIDDPLKYAHYNTSKIRKVVRRAFDDLLALPIHPIYMVLNEGTEAYSAAFAALISPTVPMSFYRRVMFKAYKYALLYHIILGKTNNVIDAEDMGWGARVCQMHLQDLKHLVQRDELDEVGKMIDKARKLKEKFTSAGKKFTARDLLNNMRVGGGKLDSKTANALFALI